MTSHPKSHLSEGLDPRLAGTQSRARSARAGSADTLGVAALLLAIVGATVAIDVLGYRAPCGGSPRLSASSEANERAAVASLRALAAAQARAKDACRIDGDDDGVGEYARLAELLAHEIAGAAQLTLKRTERGDLLERGGYVFHLRLPRVLAADQSEFDAHEEGFGIVAWPQRAGVTGMRAYFVDHAGSVHAHENPDGMYDGYASMPPRDLSPHAADDWTLHAPVSTKATQVAQRADAVNGEER